MFTTALLTLVLAAMGSAAPTELAVPVVATKPDPSQVSIRSITYGGTGCPQGSLGSFISADRQTFTLIFDQYVASIGPDYPITANRKNCQLNIDLAYPSGFQYSVFNTIYRGFVHADEGVTARQQSTFYFSGQTAQVSTGVNFKGYVDKDYTIVDSLPLTSVVWSPCGASQALNINSEVRLSAKTSNLNGTITDDSVDGNIKFIVGVQWQSC